MKTDVFINGDAIYKAETLIRLSKGLPIEYFDLSSISLDDTKFIIWKLDNVRDIVVHYERIKNSDLEKPIILRSDGVIMDGRHRIIKAISEGRKRLPAKRLPNNLLKGANINDRLNL